MFGEKQAEYSAKQGKDIPVWVSPKYEQSKQKAVEAMQTYPFLKEGDFWILMNETKSGKMGYTGLIISHNACLKINDSLPEELKFKPESVRENQNGYNGSLVFTYANVKQGIYEVGEVSAKNCKNDYPYAMAFKRLFDRVVLKQCKLAYDGIYSDSEADEFKDVSDDTRPVNSPYKEKCEGCGKTIVDTVNKYGEPYPAENVVEYSKLRFKKILCPECQRIEAKKEK